MPRATKEAQQKMHDKKVLLNTQKEQHGVQKNIQRKEQKATKADNVGETVTMQHAWHMLIQNELNPDEVWMNR